MFLIGGIHASSFHHVQWKSIQYFLCNPGGKTDTGENTTSLLDVISLLCGACSYQMNKWMCRFLWLRIYIVSLQPSLLAMGLLCYEAQEQHDPEHSDTLTEVLESLQQQLNVSRTCISKNQNKKNALWMFFLFWGVVQVSLSLVRTQILLNVVWKFVTIKIKSRHSGVLLRCLIFLSTFILCLLYRSEMGTWFVCGGWLENACLNIPPPSAPGLTARGSAGLFREERHGSWSTATTRSLIFPPYLSRPIKPGGLSEWPQLQRRLTTAPLVAWMQLLGGFPAVWSLTYSSSYFPYRSSSTMMDFFKEKLTM